MSSPPPGVSRSSDGNYNSGELALCRHTNFSRGWISSRWCRADWRRWREAPSKLQHEWKLPRRDRQIGSQAGVISPPGPRSLYYQLLPPEAPQEENMCKSSAYSPLPCPQVHKKSDVDGYRQANSGVPVTPSKLGRKVWGPDTPIGVLE